MEFKKFPSTQFFSTIQKAVENLEQLGMSAERGWAYDVCKNKLFSFINGSSLICEDARQARFMLAALEQEKDLLRNLIEKGRWTYFLDVITKFLNESAIAIKKLIRVFYSKYAVLNKYRLIDELGQKILLALSSLDTNNQFLTTLKQSTFLFKESSLHLVLDSSFTLNELQQKYSFFDNDDIFERIRILYLLKEVASWQPNEVSDRVNRVLDDVKKYGTYAANVHRSIQEEVVLQVLLKCRTQGYIHSFWLQYIFHTIGDPRSSGINARYAWQRIGRDLHSWVRSLLSQGDVKEFLETLTDGQGDIQYKYRKQFWLQFISKVQFAKVMLGANDLNRIRHTHPEMYSRFRTEPTVYSILEGTDKSCIYIDFGNIKVIEGTHDTRLRIYRGEPIDIFDREYHYSEFYKVPKAQQSILREYVHSNASNYSWQNNVRHQLNSLLGMNVSFRDIVLAEDQHRISELIRNRF